MWLYWSGEAPPDAEHYAAEVRARVGGPLLVALFLRDGRWRVGQVPMNGEGDRREAVRLALKQAGLPVE